MAVATCLFRRVQGLRSADNISALTPHRQCLKRLNDGELGTGWLFLVEYGEELKPQGAVIMPELITAKF